MDYAIRPSLVLPTLALAFGLAGTLRAQGPMTALVRSDGSAGDAFGGSVAVTGRVGLVGAPYDDDLGSASGSVYVFDLASGAQLAKWTPADGSADEHFGYSLAAQGDLVAVGAEWDDDRGFRSGSVYLFDVRTGAQVAKVLAPDGAANALFGRRVALHGSRLAVTAHGDNDTVGAVYLFDVPSGALLHKFLPVDGGLYPGFGSGLALDDDTLLAGSFELSGGLVRGSAYLFDVTTGQLRAKLQPAPQHDHGYFGLEVALTGGRAVVAEPYTGSVKSPAKGTVHVYDPMTGDKVDKLVAIGGPVSGAKFGRGLAANGDLLVIGASGTNEGRGSIHLFDAVSRQPLARYTLPGSAPDDSFGLAIAVGDRALVVGAPGADIDGEGSGAAYVRLLGR